MRERISKATVCFPFIVIETRIPELIASIIWTYAQKAEIEAKKLKDLKAKNHLFQAIDRSILETFF